MKAPEFVERLAEVLGEPAPMVRAIDRALAEADLRAKGRGTNAPDMSVRDGLTILLGVLGARTASRADEDVKDMARFQFLVHGAIIEHGTLDALPSAVGMALSEIEGQPIIDVLSRIASHLAETGEGWGADVWLEVEIGGPIALQFRHGDITGELIFVGATSIRRTALRRIATVDGSVLAWIARALAEAVEA